MQNYPNVLGSDIAGEVHEVGEGVTRLKKGDRVMAYATGLMTGNSADGGYQLYTACKALVVAKIPPSLEYTSATVLPVGISTASACLLRWRRSLYLSRQLERSPCHRESQFWCGAALAALERRRFSLQLAQE